MLIGTYCVCKERGIWGNFCSRRTLACRTHIVGTMGWLCCRNLWLRCIIQLLAFQWASRYAFVVTDIREPIIILLESQARGETKICNVERRRNIRYQTTEQVMAVLFPAPARFLCHCWRSKWFWIQVIVERHEIIQVVLLGSQEWIVVQLFHPCLWRNEVRFTRNNFHKDS